VPKLFKLIRLFFFLLSLFIGGCAHLPPGEIIDGNAGQIELIDSIFLETLRGHLPPRPEWPDPMVISPPESETVALLRLLPASSLLYFPRFLTRIETALREEGFNDLSFQIAASEKQNFCFFTIKLSPDLYYCLQLYQTVKGRLALIIDDVGYTLADEELLIGLDYPLTVAILPRLPRTAEWDRLAAAAGFQVILHCPLEALDASLDPGPGAIGCHTEREEMISVLGDNLKDLPHAVGANNHMGSAFTTDTEALRELLKELKRNELFFVDSLTTAGTVTPVVAEQVGIEYATRDVFLDHIDTEEFILRQLGRMERLALKRGFAIGIGHYRPLTLEILNRELPGLAEQGLQIVPVSDLVK